MKEIEFKKGIEELRSIKLNNAEKQSILASVLNTPVISPYVPNKSLWLAFVRQKHLAQVWAALLVLVVVGGAVVYGAENSLPGDKLYSLKVSFSEPARDFINISDEDKAKWESVKAVRRLDEAADLVVEGNLNEKNRNDLENRFNKHTSAFDASVSNLASSTPEAHLLNVEFEANISARAKVLESLDKKGDTKNTETKKDKSDEEEDKEDEINKKREEGRRELKKLEDAISDKLKERKDFDKKSINRD